MTDIGPTESADPAKPAEPAKTAKPIEPAKHIAVIYFHGMGSQRRFEETCRLVDRFDTYANQSFRQGQPLGKLRGIHARVEPSLVPQKPDVTYIRCVRLRELGNRVRETTEVHFYESYWADEMAESRSTWGVVKWLLGQVLRPLSMYRTPWKERQRERRAALVELLEQPESWPKATTEKDFERLLTLYKDFDPPNPGRNSPAGRQDDFNAFLEKIKQGNAGRPDRAQRLTELAQLWRRRYWQSEAAGFFVLLSLLLTIALVVFALAAAVWAVLAQLPGWLAKLGLAERVEIPKSLELNPGNALWLALAILLALGLRQFLVSRLGDVQAWSSYAETSENFRKRQAVLAKSVDLLSHVVSQPDCSRVVVIGHSLGTSVAYDTLLKAVHANRAVNQQNLMTGLVDFNKIGHFVTLASPIDKISYFFESFRSPFRRYRRIYDDLRGDIGTAPFSKSSKNPHIHWLNIWDRADIISGPIHSPAAAEGIRARVDNLHVNTLAYFNPGAAHGAYFDHKGVISRLFEIVFDDRGAYGFGNLGFRTDDNGHRDSLDYRGADFGPGEGRHRWRAMLIFSLLVPWFWLICAFLWLSGGVASEGGALTVFLCLALLVTAIPVGALLARIGMRTGNADPLE